ncbi:MAG: precorrin-4 C(11)-methyltransferase, partial [Firmicutes bacterium]|nr:precorrin-4 C(11)-methyltransferase [Bacillota bacterium]
LVNPRLLEYCKEGCEIHDSAYMTLEQVIDVMKKAESEGKTTVRLHTGDPSIYGAIREQFDALDPLGISYDVCPGVSAFSGAAASLKAEYTLPNVSQTVMITRMEGRTPVPDKEKIRSLAQHQTTMCLFLSTGLLEGLQTELIAGGFSPDTPAAIVYKASWPEEKIVRCRLSEIAQKATENNITKTALIVVGYFLGDTYDRSKLYDPGFTTEFREATK